jgi:hypothetical protein
MAHLAFMIGTMKTKKDLVPALKNHQLVLGKIVGILLHKAIYLDNLISNNQISNMPIQTHTFT